MVSGAERPRAMETLRAHANKQRPLKQEIAGNWNKSVLLKRLFGLNKFIVFQQTSLTENKKGFLVDLSVKRLYVCVSVFTEIRKAIKMQQMSWSLVCQCAEVEVRITGSTLSRQVSVDFNLHIHNSSLLQTASRGHLFTQDYQSTRGPSGCAPKKMSTKGMSLSCCREQNCVEPSAPGRVTGSEPFFNPALLYVPKVLVKAEKMEMSWQGSSGPSDCLQLCTFFSEGFVMQGLRWLRMGRRLASSRWASQVEKHKRRSSVFYTELYRIPSLSSTWAEMARDCFAVRPLRAPLGVLRSVDTRGLDSYSAVFLPPWSSTFSGAAELQGVRGCCCSK